MKKSWNEREVERVADILAALRHSRYYEQTKKARRTVEKEIAKLERDLVRLTGGYWCEEKSGVVGGN